MDQTSESSESRYSLLDEENMHQLYNEPLSSQQDLSIRLSQLKCQLNTIHGELACGENCEIAKSQLINLDTKLRTYIVHLQRRRDIPSYEDLYQTWSNIMRSCFELRRLIQ